MSFASMKKARQAELEKLKAQIESTEKGGSNNSNFWKPECDKAGNGRAVIRFLPAAEGETTPWITYYSHWFKGPTGQYYVEKSLTTLGQDDPVSEFNSKLWNSGIDADKKQARAQKRKLNYIANILVIKDFANPENNGKIFPYRFGPKIFDKIKDVMNPVYDDEAPINPFDFWEGADFNMRISQDSDGWVNYDKSQFSQPSPLADDERLEEIYGELTPLSSYISSDKFKSYDELKTKLHRVLCIEADEPVRSSSIETEKVIERETAVQSASAMIEEDDDDDTLSFFQGLADED